jgi:DnaJ-class molecular chaperone
VIDVPKKLTKRQKELLEEFEKERKEKGLFGFM